MSPSPRHEPVGAVENATRFPSDGASPERASAGAASSTGSRLVCDDCASFGLSILGGFCRRCGSSLSDPGNRFLEEAGS